MKTDRFSDIIRRKLESIRPEFTDKDWTRMQASLQQAMPPQPGSPATGTPFSGGVWSGSSWLLAAASVSTVVLIAFSIWQRSEINALRETVGQLKQQTAATQPAPASTTPDSPTVSKLDSQPRLQPAPETGTDSQTAQQRSGYPAVPAGTRSDALPNSVQPETTDERTTGRLEIPPKQRDAIAGRTSVPVDDARIPNPNKTPKPGDYGVSSTPVTNNQSISDSSVATGESVRLTTPGQPGDYPETRSRKTESNPVAPTDNRNRAATNRDGYTKNRSIAQSGNSPSNDGPSAKPNEQLSATTAPASERANANLPEPGVTGTETAETYRLATSLPLSLPNLDWNSALIRRAKRMRLAQPVQPSAPVASQSVARAPASQPIVPLAARLRVGAGSDVSAHTWNAGAFSEIQLNRHWAVGVGLSRATYLGGLFITANDFDNRTHRDFKKEFVPRLNPKSTPKGDDILNIDTRVQRFQIPLSLSYRIPLTRTLTLMPAVGTYLNLSSTEKIAFYFRDTPGRFDQASFIVDRSVALLNTLTLGTGVEWQRQHWVIQAGPLLALPVKSDDDWQKGAIPGLRVRVYYQF